jgi:hypothetical protein
MKDMISNKDERDRELYVITTILKEVILDKHEYNPRWQSKLSDLDNVINHIVNRRYGHPIEIKDKGKMKDEKS